MSAHTPGPWAARWYERNRRTHAGNWYFTAPDPTNALATHALATQSVQLANRSGVDAANAARIVACVNACEGIDDPASLRAQRDELLAACEALALWLSRRRSELTIRAEDAPAAWDALEQAHNSGCAAVAKARGGK